jgi:hypothetical protein
MKKISIVLLLSIAWIAYTYTAIENVYYTIVYKESASVLKTLTKSDLESILSGSLDKAQYEKIWEKILKPSAEKLELQMQNDGLINERLIEKQIEDASTLTDEEKVTLFRNLIAHSYMDLAIYRLIYEEAVRRSLSVKNIQAPDSLEEQFEQQLVSLFSN